MDKLELNTNEHKLQHWLHVKLETDPTTKVPKSIVVTPSNEDNKPYNYLRSFKLNNSSTNTVTLSGAETESITIDMEFQGFNKENNLQIKMPVAEVVKYAIYK